MSQEIEIEFKQLLTYSQFEALKARYAKGAPSFPQENHYFETEELSFATKKAALRVRAKKDRFTLTLKEPHKDGLLETHQTISKGQFDQIITTSELPTGEVLDQVTVLLGSEPSVNYLGSLKTDRIEVELPEGIFVLDHSTYANTEDYELEFECTSKEEGRLFFESLLKEFDITHQEPLNKIQRFYEATYKKGGKQW
ncbi:CYTH domain-containing protein [Paenalkalicoccus suaedae]|uniref:CYTH domain-containing protein n=1 Tax=Paenalkalicoccus suaedae TaxID=2592382 RepID=A0A859FG14_9BACI|nr:CYTH domain-containing protein [Paenalkalicoccus suaedae]QKS71758.1 CYTH domain-containing protein [Paenalkalicoccus suaedae]